MSERGYTLSDREHQKFMENYREYCDEMRKAWEYLYGTDGIYTSEQLKERE